jgi:hypothetical protein
LDKIEGLEDTIFRLKSKKGDDKNKLKVRADSATLNMTQQLDKVTKELM